MKQQWEKNMHAVPVHRWLLGFPGFLCHPAQSKCKYKCFQGLQISHTVTGCDQLLFVGDLLKTLVYCHLIRIFLQIPGLLHIICSSLLIVLSWPVTDWCIFTCKKISDFWLSAVWLETWHKTFEYSFSKIWVGNQTNTIECWLVTDTGGRITLGPSFPGTPTCPCEEI